MDGLRDLPTPSTAQVKTNARKLLESKANKNYLIITEQKLKNNIESKRFRKG